MDIMYVMVHCTRPRGGLGLAHKYQRTTGLAGAQVSSAERESARARLGRSLLRTGERALVVGRGGRLSAQDRLGLVQRRVGHSLAMLG